MRDLMAAAIAAVYGGPQPMFHGYDDLYEPVKRKRRTLPHISAGPTAVFEKSHGHGSSKRKKRRNKHK